MGVAKWGRESAHCAARGCSLHCGPVCACVRCSVCLVPVPLASSSCTVASALRLHAYVRARTNSAFVPIGAFAQDGCGDGEKGGAGGGATRSGRQWPATGFCPCSPHHPPSSMYLGGIAPCPAATAFLLMEASKFQSEWRFSSGPLRRRAGAQAAEAVAACNIRLHERSGASGDRPTLARLARELASNRGLRRGAVVQAPQEGSAGADEARRKEQIGPQRG
jgi:hypothetical protein